MPTPGRPIVSEQGPGSRERLGNGCLRAFFGLFLVAGLGVLYLATLRPIWMSIAARSWEPVDCTILESRVSHRGKGNGTYRIEATFEYRYAGRSYTSERYTFTRNSSAEHGWKDAVVARLLPGSRQVCYVNPRDPAFAVLERGLTRDLWWGLFSLLFIGVGCLMFVKRMPGTRAQLAPPGPLLAMPAGGWGSAAPARGPIELKPTSSRLMRFIGLLVVALFWNGIVSIFVAVAYGEFSRHARWGTALFLVPFVLVGLALLLGAIWQGLALRNPRLRATIDAPDVPLGGELGFAWEFLGQAQRIQALYITLEGEEVATYTRGTDRVTDRSVFAREALLSTSSTAQIQQGRTRVRIPAAAMHSFQGGNNSIVWTLKIHGDIPRYPDIRDDFTLEVRPQPVSSRS